MKSSSEPEASEDDRYAVILSLEHAVMFCVDASLATGTKLLAMYRARKRPLAAFPWFSTSGSSSCEAPYLLHHYCVQSHRRYRYRMSPSFSVHTPTRGCEGALAFFCLGADTTPKSLISPGAPSSLNEATNAPMGTSSALKIDLL